VNNDARNAEIIAMRGKKSMGLIAKEFGIFRHAVAGIFFRHSHPGQRSTGTGRRNNGTHATICIRLGGKVGRNNAWGVKIALGKIADLCKDTDSRDIRKQCLEIAESSLALADKNRDKKRKSRAEAAA